MAWQFRILVFIIYYFPSLFPAKVQLGSNIFSKNHSSAAVKRLFRSSRNSYSRKNCYMLKNAFSKQTFSKAMKIIVKGIKYLHLYSDV